MTPQHRADYMLGLWRAQQKLPPEARQLPQDNQSDAEWLADLEVIRKCMERTK